MLTIPDVVETVPSVLNIFTFPCRLMVGHETLILGMVVRVYPREPTRKGATTLASRWVNNLSSAIIYGRIYESMPT